MKLIGNIPIVIIQGDTKEYKIKFDDNISELIEKIMITSENLDIEDEMTYVSNKDYWVYKFTTEKTDIAPSDFYSYDITILFKDKDILSQTNIPLRIIDKKNPVNNFYGE